MYNIGVREVGDSGWRIMYPDIDGLVIEKNTNGEIFLSGSVTFINANNDYGYLLDKRQNGVIQMEMEVQNYSGKPNGLLSLSGEWDYRQRKCTLKVDNNSIYVPFRNILDTEQFVTVVNTQFDYDSYLYSEYGTTGLSASGKIYEDYADCGSVTPATYDSGTTYAASNDLGSGAYAGALTVFVFLSGKLYASLRDDNLGNSPAAPGSLYWAEISDLLQYSQERAEFQFDDNAEYNEISKYWWLANCSSDSYTGNIISLNIKNNLTSILTNNGYSLADDWLAYAANINPDYEDKLCMVNTKGFENIKLTEIIGTIETAFNCKHYLNGTQLYFLHWTEQTQNYEPSLPAENDLGAYDSWVFTREESTVREHKLTFTGSSRTDHANSVLVYDNQYFETKEVKPIWDVDFVYVFQEDGIIGLVTLDDNDKIKYDTIWNPYLVPEDIHTDFYLDGREYRTGTLNENFVSLQVDYLQQVEFETDNVFDINNFEMFYQCLLNSYGPIVGKLEKVVFSFKDNKFKITVKSKG